MSELFLAEAAVRVRADTAGFRAALLAEVEASVKAAEAIAKVRITPIAASATGAGAAAGAAEQAAASKLAAGAIQTETAAATELNAVTSQLAATEMESAAATRLRASSGAKAASINNLIARSEANVAASRAEVIGAESAEAAASVQLTAAKTAVAQAATALTIARKAENAEGIKAAEIALGVAINQRGEAKTALDAARAQAAHAASLSQVSRGAGSTLLTMLGLRGATLAATAPFIAAAAGAITFVKAVGAAASLQTELNVFQATAGATADQMQRVSDAAKQLGQDITLPAVTTADAAQAMTELAKAGLSVQDSIGATRGVLQLATAADIDNAQAVQIVANALNAYSLAGTDAAHVADLLANASIQAQGSIADMGDALSNVAPVARQVGLSVDDTVNLLTLLARNGIQGANAGTVLRVALLRLVAPTASARKEIEGLGVALRDASGRVRPEIFAEIGDAISKMSEGRKAQVLTDIFGERGIRGAAILAREGGPALAAVAAGNERAGAAAELAGARTKGFAGAMENLKNQLSAAALALGNSFLPSLTDAANMLSDVVQGTVNFADEIARLRDEAKKPIDFVVNIIPNVGGGGGKQGLRERIGGFLNDLLTGSLPKQIGSATKSMNDFVEASVEANAKLEDLTGVNLVTFPTVKQAQKEVRSLIDELNAAKGSPTVFNQVVTRLLQMQKEMAGGTVETKQFSKSLAIFISDLQSLSGQPTITLPIKLPPEVLSGTLGADAATNVASTFGRSFLGLMENIGKQGTEAVAKGLIDPGALGAIAASAKTVAEAQGQAAGFARKATQAHIRGDVGGQLKALQAEADRFRRAIAEINKITGGAPTGKQLKTRTGLENALDQVLGQIQSIQDQQASAAKQKAQDIVDARKKADQAILDTLQAGRTSFTDAVARAQGTPGEQDDIRAQKALINRLEAERQRIRKTVQDVKTRTAAIAQITTQLIGENQTLTSLRQQRNDRLVQLAQDKFQLRLQAAEAFGNIQLINRIIDQRIAEIEKAIAKAKKEGESTKALNETLRDVRALREETISDVEEKRIRLAELRGNENLELKLINARIARLQKAIAAAKKQKKATLDLEIALAETQKQRDDLLNKAQEDAKQGTTAFDLLKEFADTFNQNAGNLIGPNQPFAGPTGFTADIAQFLVRRPGAKTTAAPTGKTPIELNDDRLVRSLDRLTDAIERRGNVSTGTGITVPVLPRNRRMFVEAHQTREAVEAG